MSDPSDEALIPVNKATGADHLCILVHGLWGNPSHLNNFSRSLRIRHSRDRLHILVSQSNCGSRTHDGIDVGGERLAREIEQMFATLEAAGEHIAKISLVGYSLGGLVARYCIGVLYARGWFDGPRRLHPVTFTAFASPFLGVRPAASYTVAGRMLGVSGRQLFLLDSFRDSGRPLLDVLADPRSIFAAGLCRFRHRAVYANAVNDFTAPWLSSGIALVDPFKRRGALDRLNYVPGYNPVILDPACPVQPRWGVEQKNHIEARARVLVCSYAAIVSLIANLPFYALVAVTLPLSLTALVVNCAVQAVCSPRRVRRHEPYGVPYLIDIADPSSRAGTAATVELRRDSESKASSPISAGLEESVTSASASASTSDESLSMAEEGDVEKLKEITDATSAMPVASPDARRRRMVDALDAIGFRKYSVYISKTRQSHAAIISRRNWTSMEEGYIVIQHWLTHEFEV